MNSNDKIIIGSLLFPNVDQADFTGPFEVLSRLPHSELHILGKQTGPLKDARNLILTVEETLDVLHIPGGYGQEALMQFSLLAVLTQTGPLPLSALAAQAGLERTTLTRNLTLLESKGFTRVRLIDKDQRVHQIELTPAGNAAARKGLLAWRLAQKGVPAILRKHKLNNPLIWSNS
jgi:DNA-binding MarR family transcriptional regulator